MIGGEITVGTLAQFLTFMTILQMPVRQLGLLVNAIARGATCGMRLFGLLDLELAVKDKPKAPELQITEGTLVFDTVELPLSRHDARCAQGHQLYRQARPDHRPGRAAGQRQVQPRAPDPALLRCRQRRDQHRWAERRRGDAADRCAGRWRWCSRISFLFTTTIENNIAYGNPWAKERRIERAAESAQLHNYVAGLPVGLRDDRGRARRVALAAASGSASPLRAASC